MTDDDSTVPRWVLQPAATVREILGNNRRAVYGFNPGLGFLTPATGGENPSRGAINLVPALNFEDEFVDRGYTES